LLNNLRAISLDKATAHLVTREQLRMPAAWQVCAPGVSRSLSDFTGMVNPK
jgi:hypothetical protein